MRDKIKQAHALSKRAAYSKSFRRYLFVGFTTVMIDYLVLIALRKIFSGGLIYSVSVAYWTSIVYNFLLNRYWSFDAGNGFVTRQIALYGSLLVMNYLVTLLIVWGLEQAGISEYLAKLLALALTVSWTYFAYRKLVFKK